MRLRIVSIAALVVALTATSAGAHDYWLEFQPLAPDVDRALALSLWVGEDFVAEAEKAMQRDRTVSLRHLHGGGDEDLRAFAREGAAPILEVSLKTPGGHLFSLERDPSHIVLRARKFNRYQHEGLMSILDERRRTHQRLRRARERYSRGDRQGGAPPGLDRGRAPAGGRAAALEGAEGARLLDHRIRRPDLAEVPNDDEVALLERFRRAAEAIEGRLDELDRAEPHASLERARS